ncbi:LysR family transcriptional regulator [Tabrizicola aquatica]|uniref:LysR family transcriptional regulator n=1 Tax=Tabrizicola aquatica TaxID=909926 RepID=UPI000CD2D922|nr:LysR family transcriptional regulator [Tabrizicola aquatica]
MDLQLIKTFLEVAATGSFGAAAGRLYVTQSAVSLRVHRLEDQLGRPLFERTRAGVVLTPAGREFRGFATLILRNWEQARQRVSALDAVPATLMVGAQSALWPRFGFLWLDRLREELPDVAIRAETARPEVLAEMILSGAAQSILSYEAVVRPGLLSEPLMEDQLVLVSPWQEATPDSLAGRYALVDWGPDFLRAHDEALPMLADSKLVLGLGTMAAWYLRNRPLAAYLPARHIRKAIAEGALFLVRDAPRFAQPSWVIWREDMDPGLRAVAARTLRAAVESAEAATAEVLDQI